MALSSHTAAEVDVHPTNFLLVCFPKKWGRLLEDPFPDGMNSHKQANRNTTRDEPYKITMRHLDSHPREDFISPNWNVTHSLITTEFLPGFAFSWRKLLHPEIYRPLPRGNPHPETDRKGVNRTFPLCGTSLKVHPSFISRSSNWSALLQLNCSSTAPLLDPGSLPPFQVLVPRSLPNNAPACQTSLSVS